MAIKKYFLLSFLFVTILAFHSPAAARVGVEEPMRVLLPPVPARVTESRLEAEHAGRARLVLRLYLHEWLSDTPGVLTAGPARTEAVLERLTGPAWVRTDTDLFSIVSEHLPVDALITIDEPEGESDFILTLDRAEGPRQLFIHYPDTRHLPDMLECVTDFLSAELDIPRSTSPLARGLPLDEPELVENAYVSRRYWSGWIVNAGEARLSMLVDYLPRLPDDVFTAAAIIDAARWLTLDGRDVERPGRWATVAQTALFSLLGTDQEWRAVLFSRENKLEPETFEQNLVSAIAAAGVEDIDALMGLDALQDDTEADEGMPEVSASAVLVAEGLETPAQQAGAIRCLGAMRSHEALEHMERIAESARDAMLRGAVAEALGEYENDTGLDLLRLLTRDADDYVAFRASHSLWQRGADSPLLPETARRVLTARPDSRPALEALAYEAEVSDADVLSEYTVDISPNRRRLAVMGLLRLEAASLSDIETWLMDPATEVVEAALSGLSPPQLETHRRELVRLANDPYEKLAESARDALRPLLPDDETKRARFELSFEHPYIRRRILDSWMEQASDEALEHLASATANPGPHTRAHALMLLDETAPEHVREHAMRLVADPHRWVRLHAAAVAARVAESRDAEALQAVLQEDNDKATHLFLQDALARAEGHRPPPPRPAAHQVCADRTQVFNCDHGSEAASNPFQGYYQLTYKPDEAARQAHDAGKIFLARSNRTAGNPAHVLLSSRWRDDFWIGMDAELGDLTALDGVVLGEESMYFRRKDAWESGWRLFCLEAGIEPDRVSGDYDLLTEPEQEAWWHWEQRVAIEGFNKMYGYIKLRYDRLRPGFQVATFMPDQNGPGDFDLDWKFDIGAGYWYQTNNRHRYTQIRRFRTLWPDRPVIWLVDGSPTGMGGISHTYQAPQSPLHSHHTPIYADALCAWMAGASPGYFYAGGAVSPAGGDAGVVWLGYDSLRPDSPSLERAISYMFGGVEDIYRTQSEMEDLHSRGPGEDWDDDDDDGHFDLDDPDPEDDPFYRRVQSEKEAMRIGLFTLRKLVMDSVRLLADLPVPTMDNSSLLVRDIRAQKGALRLPNSHDAVALVNTLARLDLSDYRFIGVAGSEDIRLTNGTIEALTDWLQDYPGLLYIHDWLPTEATAGKFTLHNLDGLLTAQWPWHEAVGIERDFYRVIDDAAQILHGGDKPGLVYWRGEGMLGGVVFDRSGLEPELLREYLLKFYENEQIGVPFHGPIGLQKASAPGLLGAVSCASAAVGETRIEGFDMLTGTRDPVVGGGKTEMTEPRESDTAVPAWHERLSGRMTGVLTGEEFTGKYAAVWNGVAVLGERPLEDVVPVETGLSVKASGLIQAVSESGAVAVTAELDLPEVPDDELQQWLLLSDEPGIVHLPRPGSTTSVTYVRAHGRVSFERDER